MTRAEGRDIDRLSRGEAVPSTHSCARPGCWHSHLHHRRRAKGKPCEVCGCPGLIRFGKAGELMGVITEPEVARRDWVYVYKSPGDAEWPRLLRKGWPDGNRADKLIVAHELRITVAQFHGAVPEVQMIRVNGVWSNGNPVRMVTVHHDAKPEQGLIIHAPVWVMELAADAIGRSMAETVVPGPPEGAKD
jgi:hypothetical protein